MLELKLAGYSEAQADPQAVDYQKLATALGSTPLYHQWRTYQAKTSPVVVNSYNTGTGKTKAALLRLLDLDQKFKAKPTNIRQSSVLFIAPTNELLKQHAEDVEGFIKSNSLDFHTLRVDAQRIRVLGEEFLPDSFSRPSKFLEAMIDDPRTVLGDTDERKPFVFITNPDIFYYALYGLGNAHEKRLLFRKFVENFNYVVIDEFHYYNPKQLANFLFFLTLWREWELFKEGRQVCLLTATPENEVKQYLQNLQITVEYIEPGSEPENLPRTPALAPVNLRLYGAASFDSVGGETGLVALAAKERPAVENWLATGQHGVFVSGALWRVNRIYEIYKGQQNAALGRLTSAEKEDARKLNRDKDLIMATPTVDIGYNFGRSGKERQSIDFLLFDARTWDEFVQRLGRAGRVLGKKITDQPSIVWAVVEDKLVTALQQYAEATLERKVLNSIAQENLPSKNNLYGYIRSGAIAEVFYPIYTYQISMTREDRQKAESLYAAVCQVYDADSKNWANTYTSVERKIKAYLKLKDKKAQLLKEIEAGEFGAASFALRAVSDETFPADRLDAVLSMSDEQGKELSQQIQQNRAEVRNFIRERLTQLESLLKTEARFNFRDNFQPPEAFVTDHYQLLSDSAQTIYSAFHLIQNFEGMWSNATQKLGEFSPTFKSNPFRPITLAFEVEKSRTTRLMLSFYLNQTDFNKKEWEENYCYNFSVRKGFEIQAERGELIPSEVNLVFDKLHLTFLAVPKESNTARILRRRSQVTSIFSYKLRVDFRDAQNQEYLLLLGSAALLISCESEIKRSAFMDRKKAAENQAIFDWDC